MNQDFGSEPEDERAIVARVLAAFSEEENILTLRCPHCNSDNIIFLPPDAYCCCDCQGKNWKLRTKNE